MLGLGQIVAAPPNPITLVQARLRRRARSLGDEQCRCESRRQADSYVPLWRRYRSQLESHVSDLGNDGREDMAGAIVAALFLVEFISDVPWTHFDISGTAFLDEPTHGMAAGGTGVPTRTLARLVSGGSGTTTAIATAGVGDIGSEET